MNTQHQEAQIAEIIRDVCECEIPEKQELDKVEVSIADLRIILERHLASSPPAPTGWRPIETAPKDGTEILACWPKRKLDDDECPTGEIVGYAQCVTAWQGFWIEPDYLEAHGSFYFEDEAFAAEPTHWQPLPPPSEVSNG